MPSSSCTSPSSSVEIIDAAAFFSPGATNPVTAVEVSPLQGFAAEHIASSLLTREEVDAVCKKHGVPVKFTAEAAGDRPACAAPPPGAVCVYKDALEAGMRVPLHPFVCEVLEHSGLAPGQISPNGWRNLAGFVVLCHHAGVPPSLAVFRHFFVLCKLKESNGWYIFRGRAGSKSLFTNLPEYTHEWKDRFFFLLSPAAAPWPCQVRWGKPSRSCAGKLELTDEEKETVRKLMDAHSGNVDIRNYLTETNLAAAFSSNLAGASPQPPVKADQPESSTPPLSGKKRKHDEAAEANNNINTPSPSGVLSSPPGMSRRPLPAVIDAADMEAMRQQQEWGMRLLQEKHGAVAEADALRGELWNVRAELAEAKAAVAAADARNARAAAEAESARGREDMRSAVLRRYPDLDLP